MNEWTKGCVLVGGEGCERYQPGGGALQRLSHFLIEGVTLERRLPAQILPISLSRVVQLANR